MTNEDILINLKAIKNDTLFASSPRDWTEHKLFKELVGVGNPVIEYIFNDWTSVDWVRLYLCTHITKQNPLPIWAKGNFELAKSFWYIYLFQMFNSK